MQRDGLKRGVVTLCIGGGQGIALGLEMLGWLRRSAREVAEAVIKAASAEPPKLRYSVDGAAKSVSQLRRFVPSHLFEKSFRHQFLLDT
jgi:hypothetical protein